LVLMMSSVAHALQVCWTAPTENVDGSDLDDLFGYRIYYGASSRDYDSIILIGDAAATCHQWVPAPGDYFIAMTAIDDDGNESAYSNEVLKNEPVPDPGPLPPVILAQEETVYTVVKQPDRFVLIPIGTVPAGTPCDPNQSVNGLGVVPNVAVVWAPGSTVRPIVVVAQCDG
jgi:hypothetical protein